MRQDVNQPNKTTYIKIDIIDSGMGFNASDLPFIFERLYRGDKSRVRESQTSAVEGSGLGLAIVEQIIQAHGGKIVAKNHPEIGGAWMELFLPREKIAKPINSDSTNSYRTNL